MSVIIFVRFKTATLSQGLEDEHSSIDLAFWGASPGFQCPILVHPPAQPGCGREPLLGDSVQRSCQRQSRFLPVSWSTETGKLFNPSLITSINVHSQICDASNFAIFILSHSTEYKSKITLASINVPCRSWWMQSFPLASSPTVRRMLSSFCFLSSHLPSQERWDYQLKLFAYWQSKLIFTLNVKLSHDGNLFVFYNFYKFCIVLSAKWFY